MPINPFIYNSRAGQAHCLALYETALAAWPVPYEELDLPTRFGCTHVLASGPKDAPGLLLLHGQWATATMWAATIQAFSAQHRAYAADQIDDVGRSAPTRLPASRADYAEWLSAVLDQLDLEQVDLVHRG